MAPSIAVTELVRPKVIRKQLNTSALLFNKRRHSVEAEPGAGPSLDSALQPSWVYALQDKAIHAECFRTNSKRLTLTIPGVKSRGRWLRRVRGGGVGKCFVVVCRCQTRRSLFVSQS